LLQHCIEQDYFFIKSGVVENAIPVASNIFGSNDVAEKLEKLAKSVRKGIVDGRRIQRSEAKSIKRLNQSRKNNVITEAVKRTPI